MKKLFDNTVYLDFFTDNPNMHQYFPISQSRNYLPLWWKDIPSPKASYDRMRSMKRCSGFMDFFKNTYTVPLWSEILVDIKNHDYYIEATDGSINSNDIKISHPPQQRKGFLAEPMFSHIKVPVNWRVESNKSLDIIVIPPTWINDPTFVNKINVLSASKNPSYDMSMHWHFMLNKETDCTFTIEPDTPMYHFVPITDKKVVVRTHYDPEKYGRMNNYPLINNFGFNSSFYKMKRFLDKST